MIDLEFSELPTCIVVDGEEVPVKTSFRVWLRFGRLLETYGVASASVLATPCRGDWGPAALEFYECKTATPKPRDTLTRTLDLTLDGDYIVGAFQQAYGIDLTTGDMHWHRFLALLRSLPQETKLAEIIGYRAWRPSRKKQEAALRELHDAWELPPKDAQPWHLSEGASDFLAANEQHAREILERRQST